MLIDLKLADSEMFMVRRDADGTAVLTIPLETLNRAHAAYIANQAHFDAAAKQERSMQ